MSDIYSLLKPYGFEPGDTVVRCGDCRLTYALMAKSAVRCKRCARRALIAAAGYPQEVVGLMRPATSNLSSTELT